MLILNCFADPWDERERSRCAAVALRSKGALGISHTSPPHSISCALTLTTIGASSGQSKVCALLFESASSSMHRSRSHSSQAQREFVLTSRVIFTHAIAVDRYRDVINFGMNDDADDQITLRPDGNEVTFVSCAKEGLMQHFPNLKEIDVGDVYRVQIKSARLGDVPHAALLPVPCNKRVGEGDDDEAPAKRPRN